MKRIAAALAASICSALLATGNASAATNAASSNWSGYAVSGTTYRSVTGTWVQPTGTCSTTSTESAAFWVGLGGDSTQSDALEQAGTSADCENGAVGYSAWYELVPAASVRVPLAVSAGDTITATVTVDGTKVTVSIRDVTNGTVFAKTLTMADPDTSSAEWIAEAPSVVTRTGTRTLSLTNFGTVKFTKALATAANGTVGSISHAGWNAQRISLVESELGPGQFGPDATTVEAVPTALRSSGQSFAVSWRSVQRQSPGGFGQP
jgi:Peptidase A4 family